MKKLPLEIIPKDKTTFKYLILISKVGSVLILSIILFFFAVYFLGKTLHFEKIALPLGIIFGLFAGFYSAYSLLKKHFEKDNDDD